MKPPFSPDSGAMILNYLFSDGIHAELDGGMIKCHPPMVYEGSLEDFKVSHEARFHELLTNGVIRAVGPK